jgi:hypothetical protein
MEYGAWSYNCMHDHKDPYGRLMNPKNCWAIICGVKEFNCISIFKFTEDGEGLSPIVPHEACEYTPHAIAVDGQRIDTLPVGEQIEAVIAGNSLTREVWDPTKGSWPYCLTEDATVSLKGSTEVYQRLKKMAPEYLGSEFAK